MSHQRRFGNDGPPSTWPCEPKNRSDDMNEKDEDIADGGIVSDLESRLFSGIGNSPSTSYIRRPRDDASGCFRQTLLQDSARWRTVFITTSRRVSAVRLRLTDLYRRTLWPDPSNPLA